jgi:hypothetical protein
VSAPVDWQSGFLAISVLLDEPIETALACIAGRETAGARELTRELSVPDRVQCARAVGRVATEILASLDRAAEGAAA